MNLTHKMDYECTKIHIINTFFTRNHQPFFFFENLILFSLLNSNIIFYQNLFWIKCGIQLRQPSFRYFYLKSKKK